MTQFMWTGAWQTNDRVRTEGSAGIVDAALAAGVGRVVRESVSMLYPDRGAEWVDEDVPTERYPMALGNLAAEGNANRVTGSGGTGVVLRFGWFYGPGATSSEQFLALARGVASPSRWAGPAALHAPAGTFNIVDDEPLIKRGYADAPAGAAGKAPWARVPGRAATSWVPEYPSAREGWKATATALQQAR